LVHTPDKNAYHATSFTKNNMRAKRLSRELKKTIDCVADPVTGGTQVEHR